MNRLSNNRLKTLTAYRQQKNCEAEGVFVVEGIKMCEEAVRSGWQIVSACITDGVLDRIGAITDSVADEMYVVSQEQLERLSSLRSPQGVWMLVKREVEKVDVGMEGGFVLALDGIQDPGNMGTIVRICDWFGVRQVICSHETASCYNPKVVQATMGAIFRTNVTYCDLAERLALLKANGYKVYGAMLDGVDAFHSPKEKPSLLVIGNEGHGISSAVSEMIDCKLTIPNVGGTCESLNASVATGILVSEFYR